MSFVLRRVRRKRRKIAGIFCVFCVRGQIVDWSACKRCMLLGYLAILPLRVALPVSSPTGSVGGMACRSYACIEPDAYTHGMQSETLEDVCLRKYCMRMGGVLNAYTLTLCPIYEKIVSGGVQLRRARYAVHADGRHINN